MALASRRVCFRSCFFIALLSSTLCESKILKISLDNQRAVQRLSPYFLSITLDPIILVNQASEGNQVKNGFDSARVLNMAKGLSPAFLRLGGPSTDDGLIHFKAFTEDEDDHSDALYDSCEGGDASSSKPGMTVNGAQLTLLSRFAKDAGLKLIISLGYDLNNLKSKAKKRAKGFMEQYDNEHDIDSWDSKQALDIIRFADSMELDLGYQLGYEANYINGTKGAQGSKNNLFGDFASDSEDDIASNVISKREAENVGSGLGLDLVRLRTLIDAFPQSRGAHLFSPGICVPPAALSHGHHSPHHDSSEGQEHLESFLQAFIGRAGDALTAVVLHPYDYPVNFDDKGNGRKNNVPYAEREGLIKVVGHSMGDKPICIGKIWNNELSSETAEEKDFEEALAWAKHLGTSAQMGAQVILHSPKASALQNPNPQYWVSLLHKKLAGVVVLETSPSLRNDVPANYYAHCTPHSTDSSPLTVDAFPKGSVTVYAVNPRNEATQALLRGFSRSESLRDTDDGDSVPMIYEYVLTEFIPEENSGNNSRGTLLNGKLLKMDENGTLPYLAPNIIQMTLGESRKVNEAMNIDNTIRSKMAADEDRYELKTREMGNKKKRSAGDQREILLKLPAKSIVFWVLPPSAGVKPCLGKESGIERETSMHGRKKNDINSRRADHHKTHEVEKTGESYKRKSRVHEKEMKEMNKRETILNILSAMRKDIRNPGDVYTDREFGRRRRDLPQLSLPKSLFEIPPLGIRTPRPALINRLGTPGIFGLKDGRKLGLKSLLSGKGVIGAGSAEADLWKEQKRIRNQRTKIMNLPKVVSYDVGEEEESSSGEAYAKGTMYLSEDIPSQSKEGYDRYDESVDDYDYLEDDFGEDNGEGELEEEGEENSSSSAKANEEAMETEEYDYSWSPSQDGLGGTPEGHLGEINMFPQTLGTDESEGRVNDHEEQDMELYQAELPYQNLVMEGEEEVMLVEEPVEEGSLQEPTKEVNTYSEEGEGFERTENIEDNKSREIFLSSDKVGEEVADILTRERLTDPVQETDNAYAEASKVIPKETYTSFGSIGDSLGDLKTLGGENNAETSQGVYSGEIIDKEAYTDSATEGEIETGKMENELTQQADEIYVVDGMEETIKAITLEEEEAEHARNEEVEDLVNKTHDTNSSMPSSDLKETLPDSDPAGDLKESAIILQGDTGILEENLEGFEEDSFSGRASRESSAREETSRLMASGEEDPIPPLTAPPSNLMPENTKLLVMRRKREASFEKTVPSDALINGSDRNRRSPEVNREASEVSAPGVAGKVSDKMSSSEGSKSNDGIGDESSRAKRDDAASGEERNNITTPTSASVPNTSTTPSPQGETLQIRTPFEIGLDLNLTDRELYQLDARSQQLQASNENDISSSSTAVPLTAGNFSENPRPATNINSPTPSSNRGVENIPIIEPEDTINDISEGGGEPLGSIRGLPRIQGPRLPSRVRPAVPTRERMPPIPARPKIPVLPAGQPVPMIPMAPRSSILPSSQPVPMIPMAPRSSMLPSSQPVPMIPMAPRTSMLPASQPVPMVPMAPQSPMLPSGQPVPMIPMAPRASMLPAGQPVPMVPMAPQSPMLPAGQPMASMTPQSSMMPSGQLMPMAPMTPQSPMLPSGQPVPMASMTPQSPMLPSGQPVPIVPMAPRTSMLPAGQPMPMASMTPQSPMLPAGQPMAPMTPQSSMMPSGQLMPMNPSVPRMAMTPTRPQLPMMPSIPRASMLSTIRTGSPTSDRSSMDMSGRVPARSRTLTVPTSASRSSTGEIPPSSGTGVPGRPTATGTQVPSTPQNSQIIVSPTNDSLALPRPLPVLPVPRRRRPLMQLAAREQQRQERRRAEAERRRMLTNASAASRRAALEALQRRLARPARDTGTTDGDKVNKRASEVMRQLSEEIATPMRHLWEDMKDRIGHLREILREKGDQIRRRRSIGSDTKKETAEDIKMRVLDAIAKKRLGKKVESVEKSSEKLRVRNRVKRDIPGMVCSDSSNADHQRAARLIEELRRSRRHLVQSLVLSQPTNSRAKREIPDWGTSDNEEWPVDNEFMYYPSDGFDEFTEILTGNEHQNREDMGSPWPESEHDDKLDPSYFAIDTARRGLYPIGPYGVINHLYAQGELYKLEDLINDSHEHHDAHENLAGVERSRDNADENSKKLKGNLSSLEDIKDEKTPEEGILSNESKDISEVHKKIMENDRKRIAMRRKRRWSLDWKDNDLNEQNQLKWAIATHPVSYNDDLIPQKEGMLPEEYLRYYSNREGEGENVYLVTLQDEEKREDESHDDSKLIRVEKKQSKKENSFDENSIHSIISEYESRVQRIPSTEEDHTSFDSTDTESTSVSATPEDSEAAVAVDASNSFMSYVMKNMTEVINFFRSMIGWT